MYTVFNVHRKTRGLKISCTSDISKLQAKLPELEDQERCNNARIVGLAMNHEEGDTIRFLQEMLPKWIPLLANRPIEIERAHRIYGQQRSPETGCTMIFKVLRYQDHQAILEGAREASKRGPILYGENRLKFFADYTSQRWRSLGGKAAACGGIRQLLMPIHSQWTSIKIPSNQPLLLVGLFM